MSKVLVDPAALEEAAKWLEVHSSSSGSAEAFAAEALREAIAQPAEAEGVSNARLMNTLAELARRAPLRTLHTICETQRQVSTVKLERYLEPVGDTLADYAFTLRIYFDKLSATLSAVTAERDRLDAERDQYRDMAGCMDLLRRDLIEAGVIGESCPPMFMTEGVMAHIGKLRAEVERLREDAARYRWLREQEAKDGIAVLPVGRWVTPAMLCTTPFDSPEMVDAVVDAAMAAKEA